jgi:hypothetical protein
MKKLFSEIPFIEGERIVLREITPKIGATASRQLPTNGFAEELQIH